eukprot:Anaeramoba_ignava/a479157_14.p1 GENE.a479157_14~~a479157_14.p1  ORF type:complete len:695 (+),score=172.56 a479157_14:55-2139(+)
MRNLILFCFSLFTFLLLAQAQVTPMNSFDFPIALQDPHVSLVDSDEGLVYFVDYPDLLPSRLIKYDNTYYSSQGILDLGVYKVSSGIIDTVNKLAYFGTNDSQIVKVDLASFTVVETLTLDGSYGELNSAQIDTVNMNAYFVSSYPMSIAKIDLSDFSLVESLYNMSLGVSKASSIDNLNGVLYWITELINGISTIHKISLFSFSEIASHDLSVSYPNPVFSLLDSSSQFLYVAFSTFPSEILKVDLSDLSEVGSLSIPNTDVTTSGGIDENNGLVYFLSQNGTIARINLTDFSIISQFNCYPGSSFETNCMSLDLETQQAFIGTSAKHFFEVDLNYFIEPTFVYSIDYRYPSVILIDEQFEEAYVGFEYELGLVARVDLKSFELKDFSLIFNGWATNPNYYIIGGVFDSTNKMGYFFLSTGLTIAKENLWLLTVENVTHLDDNQTVLSYAFDEANQNIYAGCIDYSSFTYSVFKVDVSNFQIVDTMYLGSDQPSQLIIDDSQGVLYSLVGSPESTLIKSDLSTWPQEIDTLNLLAYTIDTMILDQNHQYMYFGSNDSSSHICRIDLITMTLVDCPSVVGINGFLGSFIESTGTYGFFFAQPANVSLQNSETIVVQIETSSNQLISITSIQEYLDGFMGVYDSSSKKGYLTGIWEYPAPFIQVSVPTPSTPPSSSSRILFSIFIFGFIMILSFF